MTEQEANKLPLEEHALQICYAIEECGASPELTTAVALASALVSRLRKASPARETETVAAPSASQQSDVVHHRLVRTALERRAETWRQNTDDPHGINTAVYVALLEVKEALSDATAQAGSPNNQDQ
jgi:hypothetical protein